MKKEIVEWSQTLIAYQLPRWEELPNFDLYSDQVIQMIHGYLQPLIKQDEVVITSSMINNYVKNKMMPKPVKKKYQRVHLAYLIAISMLKQVLTIEQINAGITYQAEISGLKNAYNLFCESMENAIANIVLQIQGRYQEVDNVISEEMQALSFASKAFAFKIVAEKIVDTNSVENKEKK
ncbi:MAG: DUF1836 domain-containing protein [Erysipelotrichia bacterium]|nr:DUF1836 domain-containing protein [Erysipelotrichia bacterium]NCC54328.1 DUF1836 domain-containing protein [Erysipelotrichia bacterium]